MSFRVVAKVLDHSEERLARRLILLVLAEAAHEDGVCYVGQEEIARKGRLSRTHVAEEIRAMEEAGAIQVRKAQRGQRRISVYRLNVPGLREVEYDKLPFELSAPFDDVGSSDVVEDGVGSSVSTVSESPTSLPLIEEPVLEPPPLSPPSRVRVAVQMVASAWEAHAPPLVVHRDAYYADRKTFTAIEGVLRTYPAEVVRDAIANYATVLGDDSYRWSHSWTLIDFLKRGLDRFVPEARPLENFRIRREKFGRPDVSARDLFDLADRLEAEDRATG